MNSLNILVLDDEQGIRQEIADFLSLHDFSIHTAATPGEGLKILREKSIDILILDIHLPQMNGLEVLKIAKQEFPDLEVIMITAYADTGSVISALRYGAFDFLIKPLKVENIQQIIQRTTKFLQISKQLKEMHSRFCLLSRELEQEIGHQIIGESKAIKEVLALVGKVAKHDTSVLIEGESGTGKELIARTIHQLSPRKESYFYPVNCAAIPAELMESELFGHQKGSFTGAIENKCGWFEAASGGTLFLDEIGNMPLALQKKLLRILEDKKIRRIGSHREIDVDVRIIAASNRPLDSLIESGEFRLDLLHRLNSFKIIVPSLKQRSSDIILLFEYYLDHFAQKLKKQIETYSPEIITELNRYDFPGNIRELKNMIERAVIICDGNDLTLQDFSIPVSAISLPSVQAIESPITLAELEKQHILSILRQNDFNKSKAASILGISWHALDRKIKKYEIE